MPLTFSNLDKLNVFAYKLTKIVDKNTDLKYIENSDNKTLTREAHAALNYLNNTVKKEDAANNGEYQGPAHRLHSAVSRCIEAYAYLLDTGNSQKERTKEMARALSIISELTDPESMENLSHCLSDYYAHYGYTENGKSQIKVIHAIANAFTSMGQVVRFEERKQRVNSLTNELRQIAHEEEKHNLEVEKLVNAAGAAGLMYYQIDTDHRIQKSKVEALDKIINSLEDSAKQKKIRDEIDDQLSEVNKKLKPYETEISTRKARYDELEKFASEIDLRSVELSNYETSIAAFGVGFHDRDDEITQLETMISQEKIGADDLSEARKELKNILSNKENKAAIDNHLALSERISKLEEAYATMNRLMDEEVNVIQLIEKSKNGTKPDLLNSKEKQAFDDYLSAREDIINNYSSNARDKQAKELLDELEHDKEHSLPASFILRAGTSFSTQLMNIKLSLDESLSANQKVLQEYEIAHGRVLRAENSEKNLKAFQARYKELSKEMDEVQKKKTANEKKLMEFCTKASKQLKVPFDEVNSVDKVKKLVVSQMKNLSDDMTKITSSKEYKDLAANQKKLQIKQAEHSKEAIKSQISDRKKEKSLEDSKFQILEKLKNKQDILKQQSQDLTVRKFELKHSYEDLKQTDAFTQVKNRLSNIYFHILDKPKDPNNIKKSPEFTAFYDKLRSVVDNICDPDLTNEQKVTMLNELHDTGKAYLDAKEAQWIPRIFASEQRYVRISFTTEVVNFVDQAKELVRSHNDIEKVSLSFVNSYLPDRIKDMDEHFFKELGNGADRLRAKNQFVKAENNLFQANELTEKMTAVMNNPL